MANIFGGTTGTRNKIIVAGGLGVMFLIVTFFVTLAISVRRAENEHWRHEEVELAPKIHDDIETSEPNLPTVKNPTDNTEVTFTPKKKGHQDRDFLAERPKKTFGIFGFRTASEGKESPKVEATTIKSTTTHWSTTPFPEKSGTTRY